MATIRSHLPVTFGIGAGMALDPGVGRCRVAVRPALFGAIIGVLGLVGTLTLEHSVTDALSHPERAGVTWVAQIDPDYSDYRPQGLAPELLTTVAEAVPPGTGITEGARFLLQVDGVGVPALTTVPYGSNLRNVRSLPWVLAAFLGLLAIAAVSHVLVSSSHRRSRDLAVLRAFGFTRRSSRLAANAQASALLALDDELETVAACESYDELLAVVEQHRPDVVLTDLRISATNTWRRPPDRR